jgi:uncharacterized protein (DUF2267 family)
MLLDFEKYAMKGNQFLHQLEDNLGIEDRAHAARILRSTFRVLRNHLTPEESLQLISQLPMALKSIYVDGWKLNDHKKIKKVDELLNEIIREEGNMAWRDFGNQKEILEAVRAVINTMKLYVSAQEMEQALRTLPKKVKAALEGIESIEVEDYKEFD